MNISNREVIPNVGFPDHLAPDEVKNTEAFGLQMGRAIQYEWFRRPKGGGLCPFFDRRDEYHKLRLYARGEQDTKIYKDLINGGDSDSFSNYDWRPIQIIPKFVKLIVNQMSERLFDIRAEATDKFSTDLKDGYRNALQSIMISKPIMEEAKSQLGVDMFPEGFENYPHSQEEIDLHMQLEYKPAIEIACEEAIKYTLDVNDYSEIQSKVIEDIVVLGIGGIKHSTESTKGITIEYVDQAMVVNSFARNRDFKDVYYYGEVKRITINELKRLSKNKYTNDQLKEIVAQSSEFYRYENNTNEGSNINSDDFAGVMVDVMFFNFKSSNTVAYSKILKSNGGYDIIKSKDLDDEVEADSAEKLYKVIDVWYEGVLVLGTDYIFNYGLCKNMIRPEGFLNITVPNYIMYAPELYQNRTRSTIQKIIPYVDQMQQIHIKIQQLIAKARPNGIFIDIDGLAEINLGDGGGILTPLEIIKIYDQTGNLLGSSSTVEGSFNFGKEPIKELRNGLVAGLPELINSYNHYMNLVRDAIGMPVGADASAPHPDMLVGVQQQLALNSNTALRHILDASLSISQKLGQGLVLRIKDIFKYSELKNVYINAIGKLNFDVLKALKKYHLHDLGINIELRPDFKELQELELNINNAISKGQIGVEDAIDIKSIKNIKLANQLLKVRKAKKEASERAFEKEKIKANGEAQSNITKTAGEVKAQEIQMKLQADIAVANAKKEAKIAEIKAEAEAKAMLMEKEFQFNMVLKGMSDSAAKEMSQYVEDRKDTRQNMHYTQMSAIQEQKQKGLPAQDFNKGSVNDLPVEPIEAGEDMGTFESGNDHVSGDMGLGTFEPT